MRLKGVGAYKLYALLFHSRNLTPSTGCALKVIGLAPAYDANDPRRQIIDQVERWLRPLARDGFVLAMDEAPYDGDLAPRLVIHHPAAPATRLIWVAYEPEREPFGVSVGLEWSDPQTGGPRSALTEMMLPHADHIRQITTSAIENGVTLTHYKAWSVILSTTIQINGLPKEASRLSFHGRGLGNKWFWPFPQMKSVLRLRPD